MSQYPSIPTASEAAWKGRDLEKNEEDKLAKEAEAAAKQKTKAELDKEKLDRDERKEAAHKAMKRLKHRPLSIFTGPFFPKPPTDTDPDTQGNKGYEECILSLVSKPFDADGVYGATEEEIMPLPFDPPMAYEYMVDIAQGTFLVVQSTIVMFLAILLDNEYRSTVLGPSYKDVGNLIKAIVTIYPFITLLILVTLTVEYAIRKFMYYRLLSLRVLVDWENVTFWKSGFFVYFLVTWALLNGWSIWGVYTFWNYQGANQGSSSISFATFIVINLQTVQILLQYMRLLASESRLVSLNQMFEKDPNEAGLLLKYTYVVEEDFIIAECRMWGRRNRDKILQRLANIFTCGLMFRGKAWRARDDAEFNVNRLRLHSGNYESVKKHETDLIKNFSHQNHDKNEARGATQANDADGITLQIIANRDVSDQEIKRHFDEEEAMRKEELSKRGCFGWIIDSLASSLYYRMYGIIHAFAIAIMSRGRTWPYRADVAYFRIICAFELLGFVLIVGVVVFGLLSASKAEVCANGNAACRTCNQFYNSSVGQFNCAANYNITQNVRAVAGKAPI